VHLSRALRCAAQVLSSIAPTGTATAATALDTALGSCTHAHWWVRRAALESLGELISVSAYDDGTLSDLHWPPLPCTRSVTFLM
jgi:hypothetical protein